ncbi:Tudor domain-containing protein 3 [Frankliniella fusca]|uniref:Tudor domain-containing protein 3 n=1 Tax=Frankliniella fusca TaxID=407009 RepID=A0AAE1HQW2_9NEOP|nr:Tudor domain-containing protein 3 [Frankliniella fusca]
MPDNARPPAPNVKPPEEFSFIPSDWVDWKSGFSQYHMLAQLDRQSEEYQANSLLYIMGQRANQVVATLDLTAAEKKNYTRLMEALDALYKATKNTVYDRAKFFRRSQQPGEPAAEFIMDAKKLATPCEFGDLKDSLIRDIIILGIRDEALSQALVLDATLNLEKCVDWVLNAEQVSQSSPAAREGNGNGNGQEVHKVKVPFKKNQRPFQQNKQKNWKCKYCGGPE